MTIPTDALRQIAEHSAYPESQAIAAELLACREEREKHITAMAAIAQRHLDAVAERDAARAEAEQARRDGQEQTAGLHEKLAEVRAAVKRQLDELIRAKTGKKPDDLLCCDGMDCGCRGVTVGEYELHFVDRALAAEQPKRDWPEDAADEDNGSYQCRCFFCGATFTGHKRRVVCKACAEQPKPADITLPAYGIDHTGKVVKLVEAEQQKSQPVSRNQMLLDFAQDWTLDGDLLRCRECKSACIASREDEEFVHRSDCKKRRAGAMPWKALVAILMQQPKPQQLQGGAP